MDKKICCVTLNKFFQKYDPEIDVPIYAAGDLTSHWIRLCSPISAATSNATPSAPEMRVLLSSIIRLATRLWGTCAILNQRNVPHPDDLREGAEQNLYKEAELIFPFWVSRLTSPFSFWWVVLWAQFYKLAIYLVSRDLQYDQTTWLDIHFLPLN